MNPHRNRPRQLLTVLVIGFAIFAYFHLASRLTSSISGDLMHIGRAAMLFRAAIAVVLSTVIVGAHRRGMLDSPGQGLALGLQLAILIAVVDHMLTSPADQARALFRTTTVIIGLPLLLSMSSLIVSRLNRGGADPAR